MDVPVGWFFSKRNKLLGNVDFSNENEFLHIFARLSQVYFNFCSLLLIRDLIQF